MQFKSHLRSSLPSKPLFTNLNPFSKQDTTTAPLQTAPNDLPSSVSTNEFPHYGFDDWARGLSFSPDLGLDLSEPEVEREVERDEGGFMMEFGYAENGETQSGGYGAGLGDDNGRRDGMDGEREMMVKRVFKFPLFKAKHEREKQSRSSLFPSTMDGDAGDKKSRFPSFSLKSREGENHGANSEQSSTRRNSIWSLASGRSRISSASSVSKWSLRRRKSSAPTIAPADMSVVREDASREQQEEIFGPVYDLELSPDLLCEDTLAPPPSLVCLEGGFQDERWIFPTDRERERQSPLKQQVDDMMGDEVEEPARNEGDLDEMQMKEVSAATSAQINVLTY